MDKSKLDLYLEEETRLEAFRLEVKADALNECKRYIKIFKFSVEDLFDSQQTSIAPKKKSTASAKSIYADFEDKKNYKYEFEGKTLVYLFKKGPGKKPDDFKAAVEAGLIAKEALISDEEAAKINAELAKSAPTS